MRVEWRPSTHVTCPIAALKAIVRESERTIANERFAKSSDSCRTTGERNVQLEAKGPGLNVQQLLPSHCRPPESEER